VELFCALLMGFFLWLMVFHSRRKSINRLRQLAGNNVFQGKSACARRLHWAWFAILVVWVFLGIAGHFAGRQTLGSQFGLALWFSIILLLGIPARANMALEVRERGILCGKSGDRRQIGRLVFTPWSQIGTCQWVPKSFGGITKLNDINNCFTIAQDAIAPEHKDGVTAAIGQFAPIYDHDGTLLAKPDQEHRDAERVHWRSLDGSRFQFDLQTMLLLVVVVACAASLCGIRYRSPPYQAMAKLGAFGPKIRYSGRDDVCELDFSACANKPTDDDLANLEPLVELAQLDLAGTPITDAGLSHLKGLKNLRHVNLANTGVTSKGMEDLQQALPNTTIEKRVQWIPPGAVPVAPTPPKGKRRR